MALPSRASRDPQPSSTTRTTAGGRWLDIEARGVCGGYTRRIDARQMYVSTPRATSDPLRSARTRAARSARAARDADRRADLRAHGEPAPVRAEWPRARDH